jgi:CRISPR-associated protein Cas1
MKKLLNSLYVTRQGSYLHRERETIVIEADKEKVLQIPIHSIGGIFCFGNVLVSPFLYKLCGENGINISFFSEYGEFYGRMQLKQSGSVLLRRQQYRQSETDPLHIARNIIAAKIASSRKVLQRHIRNNGENHNMEHIISILKHMVSQLSSANNLDSIRGIEGEAAWRYFSVFNDLIIHKEFIFDGRTRRPPQDPVNAMLSYLYAILGRDISGALQSVGLDPQVGFLHADRPGRDSLALDILEEFRAWFVDRIILSLINRKQVKLSDFKVELSGAVRMDDSVIKLLLSAYQQRKQESVFHQFINEDVPIGLLPHVQAQLLARHLRGDLAEYPPFVAR